MATRKITTNQLKKIINEVLNEGFYYPISPESHEKLKEVCKDLLKAPLTKEDFMYYIKTLGENMYNELTNDHLKKDGMNESKKNLNKLNRLVKKLIPENYDINKYDFEHLDNYSADQLDSLLTELGRVLNEILDESISEIERKDPELANELKEKLKYVPIYENFLDLSYFIADKLYDTFGNQAKYFTEEIYDITDKIQDVNDKLEEITPRPPKTKWTQPY